MSDNLTILQAGQRAGGFGRFFALVERADLCELLQSAGKFTLFPPTDEAFAKLAPDAQARVGADADLGVLKGVVLMHVVKGQVLTARLAGRRIRGGSVEGSELTINGASTITVNGAKVVRPDIMAANGVLHGIDAVLWPKSVGQGKASIAG